MEAKKRARTSRANRRRWPGQGAWLVTGGCGFIGANFVRLVRRLRPERPLVVLDKLTYAGNLANLDGLFDDGLVKFVRGCIADRKKVKKVLELGVEAIVNFAAESHVDRSIEDAGAFLATNITGTQVLLDEARALSRPGTRGIRFLQVSTDEVYGSLEPPHSATPDSNLHCSSPYSASKAAADLLVQAARHTHGSDVLLTRCTNNYGPYQFPEKMIPLMITNALEDRPLPVYGDGQQVRDWVHVDDHCRGLLAALEHGQAGRIYHFGGAEERTNLDMVTRILELVGKPRTLIQYVADRKGHDRRYSLDTSATRAELGWKPEVELTAGLAETVRWYRDGAAWWGPIKSGEYRHYYDRTYGRRAEVPA